MWVSYGGMGCTRKPRAALSQPVITAACERRPEMKLLAGRNSEFALARLSLTLRAPAKINLDLRVRGRRADGYHLVRSLVAPISLYDTVRIRCGPGRGITLRASASGLPADRRNLVWRAAAVMLRRAGRRAAVAVELTKRIPVGAGLGGGSSDAAAVLIGLNVILGMRLSGRELAKLGLGLGADVPFFVVGEPAIVTGIGERVRRALGFRRRWLVVAWGRLPVSTRWAYRQFDASLTKEGRFPTIRGSVRRRGPLREARLNELEAVVAAAHPEIKRIEGKLLAQGAKEARMSGSGSAVFGVFPDQARAARAAARLRREDIWAQAVHTVRTRGTVTHGDGRSPSR